MSNQHKWASPSTAGLVALAIACFLFYGLLTGRIGPESLALVGFWLLGGFVVQIVVAIIELMEGKTSGGNIFLFFSSFFMLTSGLSMIFKYFAINNGWAFDPIVEGYAWIVLFSVLLFYVPVYLRESPLIMNILVVSLVIAAFFIMATDLHLLPAADFSPIAGYFALASGICGIYLAGAIAVNTSFGRMVLPVGKPLLAPKAK